MSSDPDNSSSLLSRSSRSGFVRGLWGATRSVFTYALFFTFLGFGALCHDLGFSVLWAVLATVMIFAGPAQVILATTLGGGASWLQAAIAVGLSGIRLLPMTVSILPMLKAPTTRTRDLIGPAHFLAVSTWIELQRMAPAEPRELRAGFANGLGVGMTLTSSCGTIVGYYLAARLPAVLGAALLFMTPVSFLVSTARNSVFWSDRVAFVGGLILAPILLTLKVDLALLITAVLAGTAGYAVHRWQRYRA